jgi:hypothetical protein
MYSAPAKSSGPSLSPDGVTVTVLGQRCLEQYDSEGGTVGTSLALRLEAQNQSDREIEFKPGGIRVTSPSGYTADSVDDAVPLKPGERKIVVQHYYESQAIGCAKEVRLNLSNAVASRGRPMALPPIEFIR